MRFILAVIPTLLLAACGNPEAGTSGEIDLSAHGNSGTEEQDPVAEQATTIDIRASWMRPHPAGRDVTAAYVVLNLSEGSEDLLESVEIEGAERVELHGHFMTSEGVMQMREIGPQRVGDEGPLVFTPGGRHLMVFGLAPVAEGDRVSGTLHFQNAGAVPVTFEVRSMPPGQTTEY
ncbi:copper chaperone PCu(A)C [Hyphobacterium sp.]|uniref:copper chaperone PCu(A)C n=1 Tax=Hyphobacterium sp. TaxID=2004662 RepID=UPI00374A4F4F